MGECACPTRNDEDLQHGTNRLARDGTRCTGGTDEYFPNTDSRPRAAIDDRRFHPIAGMMTAPVSSFQRVCRSQHWHRRLRLSPLISVPEVQHEYTAIFQDVPVGPLHGMGSSTMSPTGSGPRRKSNSSSISPMPFGQRRMTSFAERVPSGGGEWPMLDGSSPLSAYLPTAADEGCDTNIEGECSTCTRQA